MTDYHRPIIEGLSKGLTVDVLHTGNEELCGQLERDAVQAQ